MCNSQARSEWCVNLEFMGDVDHAFPHLQQCGIGTSGDWPWPLTLNSAIRLVLPNGEWGDLHKQSSRRSSCTGACSLLPRPSPWEHAQPSFLEENRKQAWSRVKSPSCPGKGHTGSGNQSDERQTQGQTQPRSANFPVDFLGIPASQILWSVAIQQKLTGTPGTAFLLSGLSSFMPPCPRKLPWSFLGFKVSEERGEE